MTILTGEKHSKTTKKAPREECLVLTWKIEVVRLVEQVLDRSHYHVPCVLDSDNNGVPSVLQLDSELRILLAVPGQKDEEDADHRELDSQVDQRVDSANHRAIESLDADVELTDVVAELSLRSMRLTVIRIDLDAEVLVVDFLEARLGGLLLICGLVGVLLEYDVVLSVVDVAHLFFLLNFKPTMLVKYK